jgi:hypothetical protein
VASFRASRGPPTPRRRRVELLPGRTLADAVDVVKAPMVVVPPDESGSMPCQQDCIAADFVRCAGNPAGHERVSVVMQQSLYSLMTNL